VFYARLTYINAVIVIFDVVDNFLAGYVAASLFETIKKTVEYFFEVVNALVMERL
jgi:hypothetical protein